MPPIASANVVQLYVGSPGGRPEVCIERKTDANDPKRNLRGSNTLERAASLTV
jgi:hypothetical protein